MAVVYACPNSCCVNHDVEHRIPDLTAGEGLGPGISLPPRVECGYCGSELEARGNAGPKPPGPTNTRPPFQDVP